MALCGHVTALRLQAVDKGISLPVNVLAMSLGGMLAADRALRYPDKVERLALINTTMRPSVKIWSNQFAQADLPVAGSCHTTNTLGRGMTCRTTMRRGFTGR